MPDKPWREPAPLPHIVPVRPLRFAALLLAAAALAFWVGRTAARRSSTAAAAGQPETTATVAGVALLKDSVRGARARLLEAITQRDTYLPAMLAADDS